MNHQTMPLPAPARTPETSWPSLLALMDEALDSPRGIAVSFPSWSRADTVRNQMGKLRRRKQEESRKVLSPDDPAAGTSAYDALTFLIEPNLEGARVTIDWSWEDLLEPDELASLLISPSSIPRKYRSALSSCSLTITLPSPSGPSLVLEAKNAPSFRDAWASINRRVPARLLLLNSYDLDQFDITTL